MTQRITARSVYSGLPLSEGIAVARICMFNENRHSNMPIYKVDGEGIQREIARLKRAVDIVGRRLESIRESVKQRIGVAESEIFSAQRLILDDENMQQQMFALIEDDQRNAETAVSSIFDKYEARLREVDNDYIRERASDIGEIRRRVLDVLQNMQPSLQCAGEGHCQQGRNRIIVAVELTPSLTVDLDTAMCLGFVTEHGGLNSHAAILARSLGIPAVSGIKNIHSEVSCGTEILINGNTGEVIVWPNDEDKQVLESAAESGAEIGVWTEPVDAFSVYANISLSGEVEDAARYNAEGIGLYRTEFEFMAAGHQLSEDEQALRYIGVVSAMDELPVTFRLLDMGGDKPFSFLELPEEDNPALGWRGSRLLLGYPELLSTQARAIARASNVRQVRLLYPMIIDVRQFLELRRLVDEAVADIEDTDILHGAMFEVPSACFEADEIMAHADFASVGTNDLIQYLFAVDRDNDRVAYDYRIDRPAFWRIMEKLVAASEKSGCALSVCGEIAGERDNVRKLRDIGIKQVSVSARLIPRVRSAVR
jgi:phosphotransferase system enzyme I (PtsI)